MADHQTATRIPALDGLRALAVVLVIGHHWELPGLRGGRLGVDVFFVLSGFLITGLLVDELEDGGVDLRRFYVHRGFRLLPALLTLVAVLWVVLAVTPLMDGLADELATNTGAALLYLHNWFVLEAPSQFTWVTNHLWSLGIEEQFYLVWPVALALGWRRLGRRRVLWATLAVAAASLALMVWFAATDRGRWAYYRTDARAYQLMLGAALALAPVVARRRVANLLPSRAGPVGVAVILAGAVWLDHPSVYSWRSPAAHVLVVLTTVVLVAQLHLGFGPSSAFLVARPVVWLGRVSYGVYLWHLPIGSLVARELGLDWGYNPATWALSGALTLAASAASFYLVEVPARRWGRRLVSSTRPFVLAPTMAG